jgi:hypothetical protein
MIDAAAERALKDIVGSARGSWDAVEAARLRYSVSRRTAPDLNHLFETMGPRNQFRETPSTEMDGEFGPPSGGPRRGLQRPHLPESDLGGAPPKSNLSPSGASLIP